MPWDVFDASLQAGVPVQILADLLRVSYLKDCLQGITWCHCLHLVPCYRLSSARDSQRRSCQDAGGWLLDLDTVWVAPAPTLEDDKDLGHFFASLQVLIASAVHLSPNTLVLNFEATLCESVVARVHPAYSCTGAV